MVNPGLVVGIAIANAVNALNNDPDCQRTNRPGGELNHPACLLEDGKTKVDYVAGCAGGLRLPEEGSSLSPWVAITFEGTGSTITVGNDSSPNTTPTNVACIKSFEFGYSDGMTVKAIIQDEQGGSFVTFMEHIMKDFVCLEKGSPANVRMKFRFGWTKQTCSDPLPTASSGCFYALCDSVESSISHGIFTFEITAKDLCHRMLEGGTSLIKGAAGDKGMFVKDAVSAFLMKGESPNVASVKFLRIVKGERQPAAFKEKQKTGPFLGNGDNKIAVVMSILKNYPSDKGKSWIPQYNSEEPGGEIIFWEDPKPDCNELNAFNFDQNCIGAYIVNGGKSSPVIDFSPKIRWDFSRLTSVGGGMGAEKVGGLPGKGAKNPGDDCPGLAVRGAGQRFAAVAAEALKVINGALAGAVAFFGQMQQFKALKILHDNIEADLTIVGDPTIVSPSQGIWARNISIIVINPYFLTATGNSACGEWLAVPTCNEVLSNKAWLVKSITHRIEGGKYTTTIGVYLTAPGIDMPPGTGLGGWINGWKPVLNCK